MNGERRRVAIVGAGGFVGRHLIAALAAQQGAEVAGVSLGPAPHDSPCTEWLASDVTQEGSGLDGFLQQVQPQVVVHLAATTFEPTAAAQPWPVLRNNLQAALTTLTACRSLPYQPKCVVVSSSAVYGRHHGMAPLVETDACNPLTMYGVSKVAVETLTLQHCRAFGVQGVIVRPFNVMGPGEHASFVTSAFARQVALIEAGRQPPMMKVGQLRTVRDFTDVRDVVTGLITAAERGRSGETYNLCSGRGVAISDLLARLRAKAAVEIEIQAEAALMRSVEIDAQTGDASKLRQDTGWQPRYELDQTLADVLDDWRGRIQTGEA